MSRPALRTLNGAARQLPSRRLLHGQSTRWYSSASRGSSKESRRFPLFETVLVVGIGYVLAPYAFPTASPNTEEDLASSAKLPRVKEVVSGLQSEIPVASPVKVLDLEAANKKIREQAHTFSFDGKDGSKGRIDVVRVPSNNPVEDNWSVGVGRGLGGLDASTVFAGVYDGHALVH